MNHRIGFFLMIFLMAGCILPAQNPYIRKYTMADGLPSNNVNYVYADSRNFLWIATETGVVLFDGRTFSSLSNEGLSTLTNVSWIKEDSSGRIWFANWDGSISFFFRKRLYTAKNTTFLKLLAGTNPFLTFFEDSDKTLYFYGNYNREVLALDSTDRVYKYSLPGYKFHIPRSPGTKVTDGMMVVHINKLPSEELCLWTWAGRFKLTNFDGEPQLLDGSFSYSIVREINDKYKYVLVQSREIGKSEIRKCNLEGIPDMTQPPVPYESRFMPLLMEDHKGVLWQATYDNGVFCYSGTKQVNHFDIPAVYSICEDVEHNVWISSRGNGLYKINPLINLHQFRGVYLFDGRPIQIMMEHLTSGIWFSNGKNLYLCQNNNLYTADFSSGPSTITQIYHIFDTSLLLNDNADHLISLTGIRMDTIKKRIYFSRQKTASQRISFIRWTFLNQEIYGFCRDSLAIIQKETLVDDIRLLHVKDIIKNVFFLSKNQLVINASRNSIFRNDSLIPCMELDRFDNRYIYYYSVIDDSTGLIGVDMDSIFLLRGKNIYNVTAAFDVPADIRIKNLDYRYGILTFASERSVYFCTDLLNIIRDKPVHLQRLNVDFHNIRHIMCCKEGFQVASDDGLITIPYSTFREMESHDPIPYFMSILVNDQEHFKDEQNLVLQGRNRIQFQFASKDFSDLPVTYSYMMGGVDPDWISGNASIVVYQNLSPGHYRFKVRARNPASRWSEPVEFPVIIRATLWQHPLFFAGISIMAAVLIALAIVWRKNLQMKRQELNHQLITLEQRALQSMMNPHFIFNALSSIQSFLLQNKSKEAGLYLSQFARLIRQNLGAINAPMILIAEEVERLRNYLDLERFRMSEGFDYAIEIDEGVEEEEVRIPSMIIQPFVENAILHGLSAIDQKGLIRILISMQDEKSVQIVIEDNGIGMQNSGNLSERGEKHLHMGMGMTRKRLEILGRKMHVTTSVTIAEAFPGRANPGARVTLVVPVGYGGE